MELSFLPRSPPLRPPNPSPNPTLSSLTFHPTNPRPRVPNRLRAIEGATAFAPAEVTWQIAVGALAGVVPFVVAGIEFGKRIAAQRRCEACKGSGLVLTEDMYGRCPSCGGFLPWQSWKRFFRG